MKYCIQAFVIVILCCNFAQLFIMFHFMQHLSQAIAAKINSNMQKLNSLQAKIAALTGELQQFMVQYFSEIAQYLPSYLLNNNNAQLPTDCLTSSDYSHNFEQIIKQLYRTLAKHFHPDLSANSGAINMQRINQAYEKRQLGSLLLLSVELKSGNDILAYSIDDLLHYHELVAISVTQGEQELEQLQQSDAMQLKRNILLARLHGYDMMAVIANKLQRKYDLREAA